VEQAAMTAREIVETALGPLRTGYVFPDLAERAAAAIEVRLAAGEYDGMDEAALADLLTSQLNDICADKHLRVRTMPPRAAGPEPGEPAGQRPAPRERRQPPHNYGICRVSGWRATSAIWTCAACATRRTPARSSPRRWNWSRARTR
jgi:N-terminal domain of Peptidase_S41 in eukaryotic IRBP